MPFLIHVNSRRAFGRSLGQYIQDLLTTGTKNSNTLFVGFDLNQWNKKAGNKKSKGKDDDQVRIFSYSGLTTQPMNEQDKVQVISKLAELIDLEIDGYYESEEKLSGIFYETTEHYFELKSHLHAVIISDLATKACSLSNSALILFRRPRY